MSYIGNTSTTQSFTPAIDYFSGNGSTTAFTLSRPVASVAQVQVTIDNVAQNPSSAYTVSANTITFTSAPLSGTNNIYVYYTSPITQVIAPGQGTVNTTALGNITNIASGNSSLTLQTGSGNTTAVTVDTSQNTTFAGNTTVSKAQAIQSVTSTTGTNSVYTQYTNTGGSAYVGINNSTGADFGNAAYALQVYHAGAYPIVFATSNAERMRIDSSGNLLVGTTSITPGYGNTNTGAMLSNNGSHFSRAATDWVQTINQNTADGSARYLIGFRVSNGQVGNIQSNGSNCTYNSTSDYRLKENVVPLTNALDRVSQLKPVTYKWKLDGSAGEGFIAHELQAVVPECVTGKKDAIDSDGNPVYQGIDVSFLVATLTAAIQEQQALIDTQAETINALTARVAVLENK